MTSSHSDECSVSSQAACRDAEIASLMQQMDAQDWMRVGSTVTCDPPVTCTDTDVLVLVKKRNPSTLAMLDFTLDLGGTHYEPSEGEFNSWRRGDINLIVTDSLDFYRSFGLATDVATALNLLRKEDRVTLFQAILYRRSPATNTSEESDDASPV